MDEQNVSAAGMTVDELQALLNEKNAKLDEIADLVSRVRHEINNPLTGVIGQAQLLLRADLDATVRSRVEKIEQLAVRIRDIVAELRDVQRTPSKDV
jgi:signal transduction histidine kinase